MNAPASSPDLLAAAVGIHVATFLRRHVAEVKERTVSHWQRINLSNTSHLFFNKSESENGEPIWFGTIRFANPNDPDDFYFYEFNFYDGDPMSWEEAVVATVWFSDHLIETAMRHRGHCTILHRAQRGEACVVPTNPN